MSDRILEIRLNRVPKTAMEWNQQVFSKINDFIRIVDGSVALQPSVTLPDGTIATDQIEDGAVTDVKLRSSAGLSVIGRASGTTGTVADIAAGADGRFLSRHGGALAFAAIVDADIPASIARDSEVTAAIDANAAATILNGSSAYDPPSINDGAFTTTNVTVTGAALGDFAIASFSLDTLGLDIFAEVSAANTVRVTLRNNTGGTLDHGLGTIRARVWKA